VGSVDFEDDALAVGEQEQEVHPLACQGSAAVPGVGVVVEVDLRDEGG